MNKSLIFSKGICLLLVFDIWVLPNLELGFFGCDKLSLFMSVQVLEAWSASGFSGI